MFIVMHTVTLCVAIYPSAMGFLKMKCNTRSVKNLFDKYVNGGL